MPEPGDTPMLEEQIGQWRSYLARRQAIHTVDIAELEDHLREQVDGLVKAGLAADEAFLIAVKRMGDLDSLSREFAREHSDRLWKQLVSVSKASGETGVGSRMEGIVAFCFALAAAVAVKLPELFGLHLNDNAANGFYVRNVSLFVLPVLTGYFVWKRRVNMRAVPWLAGAFIAAAVFANVYTFVPKGNLELLTMLHLPLALWMAVGIAYAGGRWAQVSGRMDFIRFSGELFIYYVLIALGGGVFSGFMMMIFKSIGINAEPFMGTWVIPCGAAGAVVIGSWLVEAKQSVIENMAPVLTRLFTPLFTVLLVTFLATMLFTGRGFDDQRSLLIGFDALLALVLGLLLYSVSARDAQQAPGAFDAMQVVLVVSALLADAVALWAIGGRISEFGFTPNRVAALGENLILLVNLGWSAVLYIKFLRGQGSFTSLEQWQTNYLPVYAGWAAIVVIAFPILFT